VPFLELSLQEYQFGAKTVVHLFQRIKAIHRCGLSEQARCSWPANFSEIVTETKDHDASRLKSGSMFPLARHNSRKLD